MTATFSSTSPLMLALLSMDAYDHGYNAGVNLPDGFGSGRSIGIATVGIDSSRLASAQGAGFYAISYTFADGAQVISYRGTDSAWGNSTDGSDLLNLFGVHSPPLAA